MGKKCRDMLSERNNITIHTLIAFFRDNIPLNFNIKIFGSACTSMFSKIEPNDIDLLVKNESNRNVLSHGCMGFMGIDLDPIIINHIL